MVIQQMGEPLISEKLLNFQIPADLPSFSWRRSPRVYVASNEIYTH
jgi:hypothetical protein